MGCSGLMCTLLVTQAVACFVLGCELAWFNVDSSGDTIVSGCELAWFLMWTLLVTQTVACLVPGGELAWF